MTEEEIARALEDAHAKGYSAAEDDLYEFVCERIEDLQGAVPAEVKLVLEELRHSLDIRCNYTPKEH